MIKRNYYHREFWKTLAPKSYMKLLLAVFFTFSAIGFITDLWIEGHSSTGHLIFTVALSGVMGAAYAFGATKNWKIIPVVLIIHLTIAVFVPNSVATLAVDHLNAAMTKTRLLVDGLGIMIMIMLGYIFFIIFISSEGISHIRFKTEIDLASKMQDVLVPDIDFQNQHFQIYGQTKPFFEIGGDLIDFHENNNSLVCYTADVSGHGVAASLLMGMFKSAVHTSLQENKSLDEMINNCNRSLHPLKKPSMFLTVSAIKFNSHNTAEYTVAGHLPVMHFQAAAKKIIYHSQKQIPLSVKTDFRFSTQKIDYNKGDIFIFLSDGLTEVRNKAGNEYGLEPVEQIILQRNQQSLNEIYTTIINDVKSFGNQHDDQSLMLIRCL